MEPQYTLSDIFKHEDTIRKYCISEGEVELSSENLIHLASLEHNFDTQFADYVIFKRLHQIAEYIFSETKKKGYLLNVRQYQPLKEDLDNNNVSKERYEGWFKRYENSVNEEENDVLTSIINQAIRDNNWNFLYYLYYKKEKQLNDVLTLNKKRFNNKKFFIVQ